MAKQQQPSGVASCRRDTVAWNDDKAIRPGQKVDRGLASLALPCNIADAD